MTVFTVPDSYTSTPQNYPNVRALSGRFVNTPGASGWTFNLISIAAAESWTLAAGDTIKMVVPTPGLGMVSATKNTDTSNADVLSINSTQTVSANSGICPNATASGLATVSTGSSSVSVNGFAMTPITVITLLIQTSVPTAMYVMVRYKE